MLLLSGELATLTQVPDQGPGLVLPTPPGTAYTRTIAQGS